MHAREIWESETPVPRILRTLLVPASWLYGLGWETYLATYRLGLKYAVEPHRPVICVGNLTVGGAGKTPLTLHLVEVLRSLGREVVVGSSGYGSPHAEAASLAPPGRLSAREWGDEAAMMRLLVPDLNLVVGRRRVLAAQLVHERHPKAVLLMDDGFQHLPLRKQVTILLDPANPANAHCLPAGPYREPRRNRERADLVLPGQFDIRYRAMTFETPDGQRASPTAPYQVLCGLGNPTGFVRALESRMGTAPGQKWLLPDHAPLTEGNLVRQLPKGEPVIVTAKDWVKLRERSDYFEREFLIARQDATIEPADEFKAWMNQKLS